MNKITVYGLGAGDLEQLPFGVYKALQAEGKVYLRTEDHPVIRELQDEGMAFQSFDHVYEKHSRFEDVYDEICEILLAKAAEGDVVYAVPGHPLVAEKTVQVLLEKGPVLGIDILIGGGQSFLDALFQALKIDPIEGFQLLDATDLKKDEVMLKHHMIIGQVYDTYVASNVKLTLMEMLPYDYEIYIATAAGSSRESIRKVPLFELDREAEINNLTSVYVPPVKDETLLYREFSKFREIIAALRGPDGCPWDLKQTHQSLRKYLIEEAYELIEAIDNEDIDHMIEELGDVLLQVVLHAQIGEDDGYFSMDDVIQGISEKMIRRHPHVFGEASAETEEQVLKNWQEIKAEEKGAAPEPLLSGIVKSMPQLLQAADIQKKAAGAGFDWQEIGPAWEKVKEELSEFEEEMNRDPRSEEAAKEFGDILFALVNIARFCKIDPEQAVFTTNQKFIRRFTYIEDRVRESGRDFSGYSLEELDRFWDEAKQQGL